MTEMKYARLGWSDIEVSRVCIGGMSFGATSEDSRLWTLDEKDTQEVLARAVDRGINFIDTANTYGFGTSEEYIGKALKKLQVPRDKVVIASKVYFNEGRLSRKAIMREIDGSLQRLGTDYLDVYFVHRFDYETPIEETLEALDELVRAGKVRALGASAMYAYQFHNMQIAAEQNGWTKFTVVQPHYNLLYREDEREMIPLCREQNVAIMPYSPLASGHLARPTWNSDSLRGTTDDAQHDKYDAAQAKDMPIIERVAEIAQRKGVPMANIALAWLWERGVESSIVGCSKPSRVDDAANACAVALSSEEMDYLEELYSAHDLVGLVGRPGERALAGTKYYGEESEDGAK